MRREIKAALISPLLFTLLVCLLVVVVYDVNPQVEHASEELAIVAMNVWLFTSVHVFFFGIPYYFWLCKTGRYSAFRLMLGGFLAALVTGAAMSILAGTQPGFALLLFMLVYSSCGVAVAALTWWLGMRQKPEKPVTE
ncbi:MAG: hypothetical protein EBV03_01020 [Proteobacteria bacterium]|nr:hypothetical protein [Pseudomonadota bacterium]